MPDPSPRKAVPSGSLSPTILHDARFDFPKSRRWQTWTADREETFLRHLAPFRGQPVTFLEIGSFEGVSAIWMLRNLLTHADARLTCVDNDFLGCGKRLVRNLRNSGEESKVDCLWIDSHDVRSHVPDDHFDFVYVDASHAAPNVLFDVVNAFLVCKPGGIVGCDDYLYTIPEPVGERPGRISPLRRLLSGLGWAPEVPRGTVPKPAIDAFLRVMDGRVDVVHDGYQLWFRKRAAGG